MVGLSLLLFTLVLSLLLGLSLCANEAFRCRQLWLEPAKTKNNDRETILTNSSCSACAYQYAELKGGTISKSFWGANSTNILMFLGELEYVEDKEMFDSFLALAGGLLLSGYHVQIQYTKANYAPPPELVKNAVLNGIPCEKRVDTANRFDLFHVSLGAHEQRETRCSTVYCKLGIYQDQTPPLDLSSFPYHPEQPDMIIAHGWNAAAAGVAEHLSIPILLLLEDAELLPPINSDPVIWNAWSAIWEQTHIYRQVNQWRVATGLPRLRHIADLWSAPHRRKFVTPHSSSTQTDRHDHLMVRYGLIAPCSPCNEGLPKVVSERQTVLVVGTTTLPPYQRRRLWQGLSLAQASRDQHCRTTQTPCKALDVVNVVKPSSASSTVSSVPSSFYTETTHLLDSFDRHDPFAILSPDCIGGYTRNRWMNLSVSHLCVNRKNTPRAVAMQVLQALHATENAKHSTTAGDDDLWRVVQDVNRMLHIDNSWDGVELTHDPWALFRHHWLLLFAWTIVLASIVASAPVVRRYRKGLRIRTGESSPLLTLFWTLLFGSPLAVDDMWSRMSELDAIWDKTYAWLSCHLFQEKEASESLPARRPGERHTAKRRHARPK